MIYDLESDPKTVYKINPRLVQGSPQWDALMILLRGSAEVHGNPVPAAVQAGWMVPEGIDREPLL